MNFSMNSRRLQAVLFSIPVVWWAAGSTQSPGNPPLQASAPAQASPCQPAITDRNASAIQTAWEKQAWVSKAARKLLVGAEFDADAISSWAGKPREEFVQTALSDPRFAETVLDFNLYFLGFKKDTLRDGTGRLGVGAYDFPQAIHSAKNVADCGDYFTLFDLRQPIYPSASDAAGRTKPDFDARRAELIEGLDSYIRMADSGRSVTAGALCADFAQGSQRLGNLLATVGLPWNIASSTMQWLIDVRNSCTDPKATPQSFAAEVGRARASFTDLIAALNNPDPLAGRDLSHVTAITTRAFGDDSRNLQFTHTIRQSLTNSSTNYNRKRAAYVLDRFFCDALIPINVENVAEHKGDRHASDPACVACHYRLDPMAGFFKDYGIMFTAFMRANTIVFDDMATMEKAAYDQAWLAPSHSTRRWNIGYVRSVNDEALNSYGENLEDLFGIIKTAPEVKRCVVKRMYEYFVGDGGTIDAGYLDYLTQRFVNTSARNSTIAFKETAAQIVLSRAFSTRDPEPGTCYDFAPGHVAGESPPCRVNQLLQRHCVSCHGGGNVSAGLDLSRWVPGPDGRPTFPHAPEPGRSVPGRTTFQQMVDRLNSSDPVTRMPLDRYMNPLERQALFVWATEMLDERSK